MHHSLVVAVKCAMQARVQNDKKRCHKVALQQQPSSCWMSVVGSRCCERLCRVRKLRPIWAGWYWSEVPYCNWSTNRCVGVDCVNENKPNNSVTRTLVKCREEVRITTATVCETVDTIGENHSKAAEPCWLLISRKLIVVKSIGTLLCHLLTV